MCENMRLRTNDLCMGTPGANLCHLQDLMGVRVMYCDPEGVPGYPTSQGGVALQGEHSKTTTGVQLEL